MTNKLEELIKELQYLTKEELLTLNSTVVDQIKHLRSIDSTILKTKLKIGMVGVLQNIRPNKYNGLKVEILRIKKTTASIKIVDEDYPSEFFNVPIGCIKI